MKARQAIACVNVAISAAAALAECSAGIPVAQLAKDGVLDVAFCRSFQAANVKIDFGKNPPLFQGPEYSIAFWSASGSARKFGNGVPVSTSIAGWMMHDAGSTPDDWHRVDYRFYNEFGKYVDGVCLFSADVHSSAWEWERGFNVSAPGHIPKVVFGRISWRHPRVSLIYARCPAQTGDAV